MTIHKCIKTTCDNTYEDDDIDAYYCPSCIEINKTIAKEIDRKIIPSKNVKSDYQLFDEMQKAKNVRFVNIRDLGIIK